MAKEEKKVRYVKLGEVASEGSFFDPQLNLKLLPGKMEILPSNFRASKRTVRALAGGHLEYVDSEEVAAYLESQDVEEDDDDEDEEVTAAMLKKYNKEKLTAFILENDEEADEDELGKLDKPGLLAEALALI